MAISDLIPTKHPNSSFQGAVKELLKNNSSSIENFPGLIYLTGVIEDETKGTKQKINFTRHNANNGVEIQFHNSSDEYVEILCREPNEFRPTLGIKIEAYIDMESSTILQTEGERMDREYNEMIDLIRSRLNA